MSEVNIKKLSTLSDLRGEIASFSNVALDAIQTLKQHINEQYNEMSSISASMEQKKEEERIEYESAQEAYESCEMDTWEDEDGNTQYPDCSYEKKMANEAYRNYNTLISYSNRAREIVYKAEDWLNSFNKKSDKFQSLAGNTSQDSIRYLDELFSLGQQYVALAKEYENSDDGFYSSSNNNTNESSSIQNITKENGKIFQNKFESSIESNSERIDFHGSKLILKSTFTKNNNNKEFTTWNIASEDNPDESFLSLKMNNETKKATLGDVKTKDTFWNLSKESDAVALMEKTAKKNGCKVIESWVSKEKISFFTKNGYEINSENSSGFEIYKNL